MTIYTATAWPTNADLIADVARLGYLRDPVLDVTFGKGNFWTVYKPADLTGCDLDPALSPIGYGVDYRALPFDDKQFGTVVADPPYRLNGTPDRGDFDERYGIQDYSRWPDRYQLVLDTVPECTRVARDFFLLKLEDQVCSGRKRWMTIDAILLADEHGFCLHDRFDMLHRPRKQRAQKYSHSNYSTLLVFKRKKK